MALNANTSNIAIRRSYANTAPTRLNDAELAYSFVSDKLFIGNTSNNIITIGGEYYTNIIDSANSENIPSTLVKRNNQGRVDLGRITTDFYPETNTDVTPKSYVDGVIALSRGSIYYLEPGNTGYSNVVTTSEGVNVTANNKQVARFREDQIYFDKDFTVTGNIYIQNEVSTGNITARNIIALDQFYAGIATQLATPLPNLIAQFTGNTDSYVQVNVENIDGRGSSDYVATSDVGTDTTFYTDVGIQGSQLSQGALKALDGYLLVQGNTGQPGGNLVIGTISGTPGLQTKFLVGGIEDENIIMKLDSTGANVYGTLYAQTLTGPTIDNIYTQTNNLSDYTDAANNYNQNYTNTANTFLQANDASTLSVSKSYTDASNTWLQANDASTLAVAKLYTDTANTFLQANTGAALAAGKVYTDTANTFLQANDSLTLFVSETYTNTANTFLQANDRSTLILSKLYTDNVVTSNLSTSTTYTDTANTFLQANDRTTLTLSETYTDTVVTANLATAKAYTDTANTFLQANDYTTLTVAKAYTDVANNWLQANTGASLAAGKVYTDSANTWLQANDRTTLIASKVYTDAANTWLQANDALTLAVAESYTDSIRILIENEINANLTTALNYTNTANTFLQANDSITLGVAKNYTDIAYNYLNGNDYTTLVSAKAYTDSANTWLQANDFTTFTQSKYYTDLKRIDIENEIDANLVIAKAYTDTSNVFNQAYTDEANTYNSTYTLIANTWLQGNDRTTLIASKVYTDSSNTWLQANDYLTWTTSKDYTDVANTYVQGLNTTTNNYVLAVESYSKSAYAMANSVNVFAQAVYDSSNTKFSSSGGYITGFANVSANISVGTTIDFDPNPAGEATQKEGRIFYDKYSKAFGGYNDTPRYIHFGRDLGIRVYNNTGNTINAASPVFVLTESASGGAPHIALADATTAANSEVIGLTQTDIANGTFGMVISQGLIEYLDTTLYTPGQELFLSTTPGQFTTTVPSSPNIPLNVGYIGSVSALYGEIIVDIHLMEGKNKTTGAILFARNQLIDEDPDHLFWDFQNNSLGIGTPTPAANLHVVGSGLFTGNVTISGNLLVSNAQSITTSELVVSGNTIVLNTSVTGAPTTDATIVVNRGTSSNSYIRWDETNDEWTLYSGSGTEGHVIDSEKTFTSWTTYAAAQTYEKLKYPIGADLSNTINELAKSAFTLAGGAETQAIVATSLAQSAYNSSNNVNIYAGSAYAQANTANTRAYSTALKSGDTFSGDVTVPNLVANTSISVNAISTMVTSAYTTTSTSQVTIDSFSSSTYRSAKYQIQMTSGSNYHTSELQVLHNGTTVWIAEYGEIITNTQLGTFDATISAGILSLLFTPTNSSTTIKFIRNAINI